MANRVPRTPRQSPKLTVVGDGSPRAAVPGDNLHGEEEERIQLISFIAKATQTAAAIEVVRAPFDAAKKAHNQVFSLAKAANPEFTRKYIEKKMEEMSRTPAENARAKAMEARHDRWLGILTPEQMQMHLDDATPREAKDEVDWEARGYSNGLRGMEPKLPEGIPPRMDQPFLKGHGIGYEQYQAALRANVPGAHRLREQAADDFAKDNPEVDVAAAAKKLAKDPAFMARSDEKGPEDGPGIMEPLPGDSFEATPEELAAQKPRQAAKEAREGLTSGGEVV